MLTQRLKPKDQQREEALETNDAQIVFEQFLETFPKKSRELHYDGPCLNGELNLARLAEMNTRTLKILLFHNNCITGIKNIPEGIEVLFCEGNLIQELKSLPSTIKKINVKNNVLTKIDVSSCKVLDLLSLSFNRLTELRNLPESLSTLHCNNNNIHELDLKTNIHLKTLHCDGNSDLNLRNIPETVIDAQYPSTMKHQVVMNEEATVKSSKNIEELSRYFRVKNKYESQMRNIRKEKKRTLPKCIGCGKQVGMVFSSKNQKYQARCGGNPPCEWNIVIDRGQFVPRDTMLATYEADVEQMKQKIIQQKMITLYRHMGEKESLELFQTQTGPLVLLLFENSSD